jgi:hypothetical protein
VGVNIRKTPRRYRPEEKATLLDILNKLNETILMMDQAKMVVLSKIQMSDMNTPTTIPLSHIEGMVDRKQVHQLQRSKFKLRSA